MSEVSQLVRNIRVASLLGRSITVPVRLGEQTQFRFEVAERLSNVLQGHACLLRAGNLERHDVPLFLQPEESARMALLLVRAELTAAAEQNTLPPAVWAELYPSDYETNQDDFIRLRGQIRWKKLVADRVLTGKERIVGIDVDTGEHRVFEQMLAGLRWAESCQKPTIYFHQCEPDFWYVMEGTRNAPGA